MKVSKLQFPSDGDVRGTSPKKVCEVLMIRVCQKNDKLSAISVNFHMKDTVVRSEFIAENVLLIAIKSINYLWGGGGVKESH